MKPNEVVNAYFNKYQETDRKLKELNNKLEIKENALMNVKGVSYGEKEGVGQPLTLVEKIHGIDKIKSEINELYVTREEEYINCIEDIHLLDNSEEIEILKMYKLEGFNLQEIADIKNKSKESVKKLKRNAYYNFSLIVSKKYPQLP